MVYAQIKNSIIVNVIEINDDSILALFSFDPITEEFYDILVRIDIIYPRPGIGWSFDNIQFIPPEIEE